MMTLRRGSAMRAGLRGIWLALGLSACAGGETDSVGLVNLTAASGDGTTGPGETSGADTGEADAESDSADPVTSGPTDP
ncbi:MAG: hypothetical protein ACE37F_01515, partial [Nannocystaceae bacterium]